MAEIAQGAFYSFADEMMMAAPIEIAPEDCDLCGRMAPLLLPGAQLCRTCLDEHRDPATGDYLVPLDDVGDVAAKRFEEWVAALQVVRALDGPRPRTAEQDALLARMTALRVARLVESV